MVFEDMANYAANKALRKLGIRTEEKPEPMFAEFEVAITSNLARFTEFADATSPFVAVGNRNLVIWDGTPYVCETKLYKNLLYVGNATKWITPEDQVPGDPPIPADNGVPFCLRPTARNGAYGLYVYGEAGTHTLEIQNLVKVTTPISGKHLPEGGVGYTETKMVAEMEFSHLFTKGNIKDEDLGITLTGTEKFLEQGHVNYVYWDGQLYVYETKHSQQSDFVQFEIGGAKDSGEPFFFRGNADGSSFMFLCWDELNTTHTFKICDKVETIHPISDKYLPEGFGGGGLPVVELTTPLPPDAEQDITLSADEAAAFASAVQMGTPVVCKFPTEVNGNPAVVSIVLNLMALDGDGIYIGEIRPILFSGTPYALIVFAGAECTANFTSTANFGNQ